jgi:hypothetical protein
VQVYHHDFKNYAGSAPSKGAIGTNLVSNISTTPKHKKVPYNNDSL